MSEERQADTYYWKNSCAVFLDAVGYSSSIETSTLKTRQRLSSLFTELEERIIRSGGRVIDKAGDGLFAEFSNVAPALHCVSEFHDQVDDQNSDYPIDRRMKFRCGVAYGKVLQEEHLISGTTVNIAARLQQLAEPGATNVDGEARKQVEELDSFSFVDLKFRILKGISNPVRIWRLLHHDDEGRFEASSALAAEYKVESTDDWVANARGVAVLPFEVPPNNSLVKEDDEYLALGMASDIANGLSRSNWLKVISPRSSMNYSDATYQNNDIARELGVRYLLKGLIREAGETVRISASLIDCETGHTVWSESYDRREMSIFDIQDEITDLIVAKIEPEFLRHESERAANNRPRDVNAWDLLMRARWHFWRGTAPHIKLALGNAEKALQLEPDSAQTMALLSFCHMTQVWTGLSTDSAFQLKEALRFANQAVNLDEMNHDAHFTLGTALSLVGKIGPAIAAERRALELNPNCAGALGEYGRLLAFSGKAEEARRVVLKAIELSPSDPHISLFVRSLGIAAFIDGDYKKAAGFASEAAAKRPDWFFHHAFVAVCEVLAGNKDAAYQAMAEGRRQIPNYPLEVLKYGHPFTHKEHMDRFLEGLRLSGWHGR